MFPGFEDEMIDFFWGVRLNNHCAWFQERKDIYVQKVYEPMKALAQAVCAGMEAQYKLESAWKCSRIYRDARRPQPEGPYRDHLWFVLAQRQRWSGAPTFYAEIGAEGLSYGFGAYSPSTEFMNRVRAKMAADPARIEALITRFEADGSFQVFGDSYKRPKGHVSEKIDPWYNRKNLGFSALEEWNDANMSADLPKYLVERLGKLIELYQWMWECVPPEE